MKMKQAVVALIAVGMSSAHAHADDAQTTTQAIQAQITFSETDINALFDQDAKPMELAALSVEEMRKTEGAVFWFAPVVAWTAGGAALGAYTAWRSNGSVSYRDIGAGATAGFYASPMGRPLGTVGQFAAGTLGASSWYWY